MALDAAGLTQEFLTLLFAVEDKTTISHIADFVREYPELTVLINGTEQPKQRPQEPQQQKEDYSGRKKHHTFKQIITTTTRGLILDQRPAVGGRCHDFRAFKAHVAAGGAADVLLPLYLIAQQGLICNSSPPVRAPNGL